jgi:hypothetical protein
MDDKGLSRLLHVQDDGADRPGWRCPDAARLAAYVEHRAEAKDEARIESHLAGCSACLEQVAFLLRRPGGEESTVPTVLLSRARDLVVTQSSPWRAPVWRWGTVAAAAACLVLAVGLQMRQAGAPPLPGAPKGVQAPAAVPIPAARQPDVPAVVSAPPPPVAPPPAADRRSAAALSPLVMTSPAENQVLSPRDPEFRWLAVPGSIYYELSLVTENGDVVWQGRVEGTLARLPASVTLQPGAGYFVWVRAYLAGGVTLKSAAVPFRVGTR